MRKYINAAKAVFVWCLEGAKPIDPWSRQNPNPDGFNPNAFRNVGRGGKFSKWETAKIIWNLYVSVGSNKCFDIDYAVHKEIESRSRSVFR